MKENVSNRFFKTLKNTIFKYLTSISKNVYNLTSISKNVHIDKLADTVND